MEPRSTKPSALPWRRMKLPIQGCRICPSTNGASSCSRMDSSASTDIPPPPLTANNRPTSNGVRNMPKMFDADADTIAAETLPPAIEVKAMDDWTVEGRTQRKRMPVKKADCDSPGTDHPAARPRIGNRMNVDESTARCSLQCVMPATTASRDSRAPCRKNRSPTANCVASANHSANSPCTGSTDANRMVTISMRVNLSGRKRIISSNLAAFQKSREELQSPRCPETARNFKSGPEL